MNLNGQSAVLQKKKNKQKKKPTTQVHNWKLANNWLGSSPAENWLRYSRQWASCETNGISNYDYGSHWNTETNYAFLFNISAA